MVVAENRTGVANMDTPAVIPNQMKLIHAGFVRTAITRFRDSDFTALFLACIPAHAAASFDACAHRLDDMTSTKESQLASSVLMIRPARFESNPHTAASNKFQGKSRSSPEQQQIDAAREFDGLKAALESNGIQVIQIDDTHEPHTPDSVFPNNWVSFHADGTVVLYPMEAPNRRTERRTEIVAALSADYGFQVREVLDLSAHETEGQYLEGTGSLVLDRVNRIAYACLSSRTHLDVLGDFAQRMNYKVVAFEAVDRDGDAIYHTNVLMNVGEELAVICSESIQKQDQREAVDRSLQDTGHEVIHLSFDQLDAFAGNMLELRSTSGERVIAMSEQARNSLDRSQLDRIEANAKIISAPIDRIESSAGGSVRCMLAEIHLPQVSI